MLRVVSQKLVFVALLLNGALPLATWLRARIFIRVPLHQVHDVPANVVAVGTVAPLFASFLLDDGYFVEDRRRWLVSLVTLHENT